MDIIIKRVSYGKNDTPEELREYKIVDTFNSPVGTIKEWKEYAKSNNFEKVIIKKE